MARQAQVPQRGLRCVDGLPVRHLNRAIQLFSAGLGRVLSGLGLLTGVAILAIAFFTGWEVFNRGLLGRPTVWVVEVSGAMLVGIGFLAGAYAMLENRHVRVDIIFSHLPPRARAALDILIALLILPFLVVLMWQGGHIALEAYRSGFRHWGDVGIPQWYTKIWVPAGGLLILLVLVGRVRESLVALTKGGPGPSGRDGRE